MSARILSRSKILFLSLGEYLFLLMGRMMGNPRSETPTLLKNGILFTPLLVIEPFDNPSTLADTQGLTRQASL